MKIIAHRGASAYAPENTIEAFEKAVEMGADMIEFDVRRTQDGKMIIHHDPDIDGRLINEMKLDELREAKPEVPTFQEVLEEMGGKIKMDVELKEEGYEEEAVSMIRKHLPQNEFIITSLNVNTVKIIKEKFPELKIGLLIGQESPKSILDLIVIRVKEIFPFGRLKKIKADYLVAHWQFLWVGIIFRAKLYKVPVIIWGSNDSELAKKLANQNVPSFITDVPDIMLK